MHVADHRAHRIQRVPLVVDHQAEVCAANAKGVDQPIEFLVLQGGRFHVAVSADPLNADTLAQQAHFDGLVAFGRAYANPHSTFHVRSPLFRLRSVYSEG